MLSLNQEQSLLNALVWDLVQESRGNHRVAEACFEGYRVTVSHRFDRLRVALYESGTLVDVAWESVHHSEDHA
ncbi:MAG: hypothetical protein IPG66_06060 [Hydrogenophilales bacterium]|nr:hypothetical protein [Hydrogenophilales bacterium]